MFQDLGCYGDILFTCTFFCLLIGSNVVQIKDKDRGENKINMCIKKSLGVILEELLQVSFFI